MRKALCILLALSLLLSCSAALAWGESNADKYEKALDLLAENKFTEAAEAFAALGHYSDAPRYTMYCRAIIAGEAGLYSLAAENLESLGDFLDSSLLATYYAGLSWEATEHYEKAGDILGGITLYGDVAARVAGYPDLINARDYRKAEANEENGELEAALSGFKALGDYSDSADRAAAVQTKIEERDAAAADQANADAYAAADAAEQQGELETALTGFTALGDYSDSADRAAAVQTKIEERDAAAVEQANADAYAAADAAEQQGNLETALTGFKALGDYSDSAARAAAVQNKINAAVPKTIGAYVTLGTYPQTAAGNDRTPIEWLVLEYDETNNRSLLISRYGLDAKRYNTKHTDVTWENCTLRQWLNSEFLNKAFSTEEQRAILLTEVDNGRSQGDRKWNTNGGNNTQDKVFLLSCSEANKYFSVTRENTNNTRSRVEPTSYATKHGALINNKYETDERKPAGFWLLRSPGYYQDSAALVNTNGALRNIQVDSDEAVVRPALWIDLNAGIF